MRKKLLFAAGIILVILVGIFFGLSSGLSEGVAVTIHGIDLTNIPDGSYTGVYEFRRWSNMLVVHISDNKITGISIEKDVFGAEAMDCSGELFRRVIEAQNTTVDAVSGATVTSKAYLKAIEDALR